MLSPHPEEVMSAEVGRRRVAPPPVVLPMPTPAVATPRARAPRAGFIPAVALVACLGVVLVLVFMNHQGHATPA